MRWVQNRGGLTLGARLLLAITLTALGLQAQGVEIINEFGAVTVHVTEDRQVRATRPGAAPGAGKFVNITRSQQSVRMEAVEAEDGSSNIEVSLPLGVPFTVRTVSGSIEVVGMVRRATLYSQTGSLTVEVPLDTTALSFEMLKVPATVRTPPGRRMPVGTTRYGRSIALRALSHAPPSGDLAYGIVNAELQAPRSLTVRDWPLPRSWPLKPHMESERAVERLLRRAERRDGSVPPTRDPLASAPAGPDLPVVANATPVFSADVRMVSMSVAVSDNQGRPMTGLGKSDFEVREDGVLQDIRVVDPEESPFNLAILLDLSGSTSQDLDDMREAALRLIDIARPSDRVALYAMAGGMFHRLAALTADREVLSKRLASLPYPSGGSPLWDTIVLAYDDELSEHEGERNALIVISDGIDNRISGHNMPSTLRAKRLTQVVEEMDVRIYPIFLLSGLRFGRGWSRNARNRLDAIARTSGGRLFDAESVQDVEPVLPSLAQELRSVYGIAYYPKDQEFDGTWRRVRVKVAKRDVDVRSRPGYFAD